MLLFTRSRSTLNSAAVAASLMAAATALAANPAEAPSLAEYIKAICTAGFHSAPPREAPFLAENVGAMTQMMVGMEITADRRCRSRFRGDDDPAPSGRHRHGAGRAALRPQRAAAAASRRKSSSPSSRRSPRCGWRSAEPLPPSVAAPDQPSDLSASDSPADARPHNEHAKGGMNDAAICSSLHC